VFIELKQYQTTNFDQLFDMVQTIDWTTYIHSNPIVVTAVSKYSQLSSTPTIQSIVKKSIVKKILGGKE
jgi:23S rRNA G2445 N2-methylase RlmL